MASFVQQYSLMFCACRSEGVCIETIHSVVTTVSEAERLIVNSDNIIETK